jgi:hypothetical protein
MRIQSGLAIAGLLIFVACSSSPVVPAPTPVQNAPDGSVSVDGGEDSGPTQQEVPGTISWTEGGESYTGKRNPGFRDTVTVRNGGLQILIVSSTQAPKLRFEMFFPATDTLANGTYLCQQSQEPNGRYINVRYTKGEFDYIVGEPALGFGTCEVTLTSPVSNGAVVKGTFKAALNGTNGAPNLMITNGSFEFEDIR